MFTLLSVVCIGPCCRSTWSTHHSSRYVVTVPILHPNSTQDSRDLTMHPHNTHCSTVSGMHAVHSTVLIMHPYCRKLSKQSIGRTSTKLGIGITRKHHAASTQIYVAYQSYLQSLPNSHATPEAVFPACLSCLLLRYPSRRPHTPQRPTRRHTHHAVFEPANRAAIIRSAIICAAVTAVIHAAVATGICAAATAVVAVSGQHGGRTSFYRQRSGSWQPTGE